MPSIEGGGVEKNLFLISNYLSGKFKNLSIITTSFKFKKRFKKKIRIIGPKINFFDNFGRLIKYLICSLYLLFEILKNRDCLIISFQGNIFAILISKLMNKKIIVRANSAPAGWIDNFSLSKIRSSFLGSVFRKACWFGYVHSPGYLTMRFQ